MKLKKFAWHIKLKIINLSLELKDDHILNFNADCSKLAIIEIRESCNLITVPSMYVKGGIVLKLEK